MAKNDIIPLEEDEQKTLVEYLEMNDLLFTAIPNSYQGSWGARVWAKKMGMRPGFPDMIVIISETQCRLGRSVMLCIELKRIKHSYPTPEQEMWISELNMVADVEAKVCHGAKEAIELIESLLDGRT